MRMDLPLRFRIGFAVVGVVLLTAMALFAVKSGTGAFGDGYELTAVFDTSTQGLDDQSDVKIRGVNVGTVEAIELRDDGKAAIRMTIKRGVEIADTTVASIEPLSIFGPKYIRLEQGDHEREGPFLQPGGRIAETIGPVEFTEVLGNATRLLQAIDPDELVAVVQAVADGLGGLGPEIGQTIDGAKVLTDVVGRNLEQVEPFLRDLALVADTLAARGDELVSISDDLHQVLPELTGRNDAMTDLLRGFSQVSSDVADLLEGHEPAIDGLLVGLEQVVAVANAHRSQLPELLTMLDTFFSEIGGTIRVPAPEAKTLGAMRGVFSQDPCVLLVGILGSCPEGL